VGDPQGGATYTHGYHSSVLRSHNNRTVENSAAYLAAELRPGLRLLDVGSGAGTITADLAARVAPGDVVALELTEESRALTQAEVMRQGQGHVRCVVGDVHALDFPDHSFDIVHAHQVLQHVADPVQALREMKRVCRPGGLVAARDADYAGFIWYPLLPELDDWLSGYRQAARANGGEPDAGRFLLHWARQAGFSQIECSSSTWCLATPEARAWWGGMWADRILQSRIAAQLLEQGLASQAGLQRISDAWRRWMAAEDGWMSIVHGEILCRA